MAAVLPLFDKHELDAIRYEREELLKRLQRGGMDAHSRIRTEQKVKLLTADLIRLELRMGLVR
ncbi:hypothetical protein [Rhizobium mayense]|uniref:DUF465 domain-containing protein n=1 Tax=Rhizobium mayense TaxID=1312184 RepID=A0ABT7JY40_9HYPH|nr:hypothetical protein [Rhizobium mayense]MDL2401274.1 hypothetical protein [Rhizobium mayense]